MLTAVGAVVALAVVLLSASGSTDAVTSNKAQIRRQLVLLLHERLLVPHWVACVPSGKRYEGVAVIRCNVNFGDPHIEAYCSVLRGNRLVTNHQDESIPCGHDDAGWRAPIRTFG